VTLGEADWPAAKIQGHLHTTAAPVSTLVVLHSYAYRSKYFHISETRYEFKFWRNTHCSAISSCCVPGTGGREVSSRGEKKENEES
jgi:hypothetical protein